MALLLISAALLSSFSLTPIANAHTQTPPPGSPPIFSYSRYADSTNPTSAYNAGWNDGYYRYTQQGPTFGVGILAFGAPWYENGVWGTRLPGTRSFRAISQIEQAVKQYARGFYDGTPSPYVDLRKIRIAVGTSNDGLADPNLLYQHGQLWGYMVNRIGQWVRDSGYGTQITVVAANDVELEWSPYSEVLEWIRGYRSVARHIFYDFGDAAGCYPAQPGWSAPWMCGHNWTRDQVFAKAYGAGNVYPIPQIYYQPPLAPQAGQWQKISLYSRLTYNRPVIFAGSLTENMACRQRPGCVTPWNTPSQGWNQLWGKLNNEPLGHSPTCVDPPVCHRTDQYGLGWSSDIMWGWGEPLP